MKFFQIISQELFSNKGYRWPRHLNIQYCMHVNSNFLFLSYRNCSTPFQISLPITFRLINILPRTTCNIKLKSFVWAYFPKEGIYKNIPQFPCEPSFYFTRLLFVHRGVCVFTFSQVILLGQYRRLRLMSVTKSIQKKVQQWNGDSDIYLIIIIFCVPTI